MDEETQAKELLTWYFHLCSEGPWQWTDDNQVEVESIINLIGKRIDRLEERVKRLEDLVSAMDEALEGVYFRR